MNFLDKVNMQTIKKISLVLGSLAMTALLTSACAQTDQEATIKKLIEPKLGKNVVVDSVKKTNYAGLYEVQVGDDIVYTDEKAQYLITGSVIDLNTHRELTK